MDEVLPEGGIYEVYFRYTYKLEEYTNSSSDIPKLSEIGFGMIENKNIYKLNQIIIKEVGKYGRRNLFRGLQKSV